MSQSATPAMRNEATRHVQTPKVPPFAELTYKGRPCGARADGCGRLRTVANGFEHKRNVERTHPQPPDPQSETGTLATPAFRNQANPASIHQGWHGSNPSIPPRLHRTNVFRSRCLNSTS